MTIIHPGSINPMTVGTRGSPARGFTPIIGGIYPNEPAGYTRAWENDFDQKPDHPADVYGAAAGTDWWDEGAQGGPNPDLSIVVDATTPFGNDKAIRWEFPLSQSAGSAPVNFNVNTLAGSERHDQYVCVVLKVEGTDYENQAVGTKLGYFGYADDTGGVFNQCIIIFWNQSGGVQAIEGPNLHLGFIQQGVTTGERNIYANIGDTSNFPIGSWVKIEYLMKMNDVGSANGELHVWLNGVKVHELFDVVWRNSTWNKGFQGWKNEPVWGGIGGSKTRADFWRVAHIYCSGTPFVP